MHRERNEYFSGNWIRIEIATELSRYITIAKCFAPVTLTKLFISTKLENRDIYHK